MLYDFTVGCDAYAAEDGFPQVLDLSDYVLKAGVAQRHAPPNMSIFAAEFDRLNGDLSAGECQHKVKL